jgi:hypothetical protein
MMSLRLAWALLGALIVCSAHAQAPPTPLRLSAADRAAALQAIAKIFEEQYVFPQLRPQIVARLDAAKDEGRYDVDDPIVFAERITQDLREVSHDGHAWLSFDPAAYAASSAPAGSENDAEAFWRRRAIRNHHGLTEMRILGGNVRYLKISGFEWADDVTGAAYDAAMRFLKDGDAVIIDLRGNGGGSHPAVRHLVSHFMGGNVLEMTFLEGSKLPEQSRTLEYLPAGRLQGAPLYVLIDGGTASAAEAFAYDVQQFKLGELVGTRTAGAANNNNLLPVTPGFILSVSYGRPVHAVSETNWEGVGVEPTVGAQSLQALDVAESLALTRLEQAAGATPEQLAEYAWAKIAVEARLHPVTFTPARLKSLAGRYGRADVSFRDGALWLTRPDRPTARLSLLTADGLFALAGRDGVRVRLTGRAMEMLWVDEPTPRVFPRS